MNPVKKTLYVIVCILMVLCFLGAIIGEISFIVGMAGGAIGIGEGIFFCVLIVPTFGYGLYLLRNIANKLSK